MKSEDQHSDKWVAESAPVLHSLKGKDNFTVPSGFWTKNKEAILNELDEEAADISKSGNDLLLIPEDYDSTLRERVLKQLEPDENDFAVPTDFFKTQKSRLFKRIEHDTSFVGSQNDGLETERAVTVEKGTTTKLVPFRKKKVFWSAVASVAAVALIVISLWQPAEAKCETFACLLEQYELNEEDYLLLDESDLIGLIDESDLTITVIDDDAIMDYLIDSDLDLDEFIIDNEY